MVKYTLYNLTVKLVIVFCFISSILLAQGPWQNQKKYWFYKARLNNDFVKVGLNAGESFIVGQRSNTAVNLTDIGKDKMSWGDGTATLGHYLALLATEYYLLQQNGQDLTRVKRELYCALNAVNRVDYKAELLYGGTEDLNGFFCKDDVPANFVKNNYNHFNYYNTWNGLSLIPGTDKPYSIGTDRGFSSILQHGVFTMDSDWKNASNEGTSTHKAEESQDHLYNLLFGLAFVTKFVNGNAKDYFPYDSPTTKSFALEASRITERLVNHIKSTNWYIKNGAHGNNVDDGYNAQLFAYAIAEASSFIKGHGETSAFSLTDPLHPPITFEPDHNWFSKNKILAFAPWNALAGTVVVPPSTKAKIDNALFYANLSAVCNCVYNQQDAAWTSYVQETIQSNPVLNWLGFIISWVTAIITTIITVFNPGGYVNATAAVMQTPSFYYNIDHAPLARKVLHPGNGIYLENPDYSYEYLLNTASCAGAYNLGGGQWGHEQWSSDNRCDHPDRTGKTPDAWGGEFNGVDYMLYYNLWKIREFQKDGTNSTIDMDSVIVNTGGVPLLSFMPTGVSIATPTGETRIDAFEYISMENTKILAGEKVNIRAGKSIHIGPGVSIISPSTVHFDYPHPFTCGTSSSVYYRHAGGDSIVVTNEDYSNIGKESAIYHYNKEQVTANSQSENATNLNNEINVEEGSAGEINEVENWYDNAINLNGYPSPTKGKYTLVCNIQAKDIATITISDLFGKILIVKDNVLSSTKTIDFDLSKESNGVYIVNFKTNNGFEKTLKLVKN